MRRSEPPEKHVRQWVVMSVDMPLSVLLAASAFAGTPPAPASVKVCVFFEGSSERTSNGKLHAIMLENLLGHFREVTVRPIELARYRAGGLAACDRAAYVGSDFGTEMPPDFLRDAAAYRRPFLWLNYGIWKLQSHLGPERFAQKTGFKFLHMRGADDAPEGDVPAFYRYFDYKGTRFKKVAFRRKADGLLVAAPEIALVQPTSAATLATATHSGDGSMTAYVTEKDGFFYVADNPFLFISPQDRYLILADLLFDFLRLPPRGSARNALLRIEDIHPNYDLRLFYRTVDLLKRKGVPFAVSLIPKFVAAGRPESAGTDLTERPAFIKALRYAQDNGGDLLLHGYTHDVAATAECPALGTGAGYEFWDRCRQAPLAQDSSEFARGRVVKAKRLLVKAGLYTVAWVTPHYAASPADYAVFARYFDRIVQRVCYFAAGEPPPFVTQFFPYTIYKDRYGQFVWPEDLGFVPMPGTDWGYDTPGDIAETARGMSVVRDSWASFYWHPQLMARPGEAERLSGIIDSVRASGYEFISLKALRARGE